MIQVAWLTGHWFLSQFTVVKRSIRTLVTGRVHHISGNILCCYSLGRQVGIVAFCRSFRPLFYLVPVTCSFCCYQGQGYCLCCTIHCFSIQSQTVSGKVQELFPSTCSLCCYQDYRNCVCCIHCFIFQPQTVLKLEKLITNSRSQQK